MKRCLMTFVILFLIVNQASAQLATNTQTTDGKDMLYNNYPGDVEFNGMLTVSNIVPISSNTSLGTAEHPFQDVYVSTGSIYIGETRLSVNTNGELAVGTNSEAQSIGIQMNFQMFMEFLMLLI